MEKALWTVFAWIGFITIAILVVLFAYCAYDALKDVVCQWRWERKYKHRFDKSPTAACYCKDCHYYSKSGKCENVIWADRYTPDNGFCYDAIPMTAKEAKKRGQ